MDNSQKSEITRKASDEKAVTASTTEGVTASETPSTKPVKKNYPRDPEEYVSYGFKGDGRGVSNG